MDDRGRQDRGGWGMMWGSTLLLCPLSMPSSIPLSPLTHSWPPSTLHCRLLITLVIFFLRLNLSPQICLALP
jgi:hypothetical protein